MKLGVFAAEGFVQHSEYAALRLGLRQISLRYRYGKLHIRWGRWLQKIGTIVFN